MLKRSILVSFISIGLAADPVIPIELNTSHMNKMEVNISTIDISEEQKTETAFQKASLPMKAVIIVGVPIVAVGAVVYYVILTPFALVRWVFESKK